MPLYVINQIEILIDRSMAFIAPLLRQKEKIKPSFAYLIKIVKKCLNNLNDQYNAKKAQGERMESTKDKILAAAADLFAQKGFAGTSISEIAQHAHINQSLIYHHIGNKHTLWVAVKNYLVELAESEVVRCPAHFRGFLESVLKQRLHVYESDPRIGRLIQWQLLEGVSEELAGGTTMTPIHWAATIHLFQEQGKVSKQFPANHIALFIHSAMSGLVSDAYRLFLIPEEEKQLYIQMVVESIAQFFEEKSQ